MFRALRRRVPRFGFVTLFALMLLFVSAAGWLKFHIDLWREEEALFADLSKAGVDYSYSRYSDQFVKNPSRPGPSAAPANFWDSLVPSFSRVELISLEDPAPRSLVERAARLPYARTVGAGVFPPGNTPLESIAAKAGIALPRLEAPAIPKELEALPRGEPVDETQAKESVANLFRAWNAPRETPSNGSATFVFASLSSAPWRTFEVRDGDRLIGGGDGHFVLVDRAESGAYIDDGRKWRQLARLNDPQALQSSYENADKRIIRHERSDTLRHDLEQCKIDVRFDSLLREPRDARVERIDDVRIRIDLPPIVVPYPAVDCEDAYSVSMIARSDLDWELEAWDIVGVRTPGPKTPKNLPPIRGASYRGTLRREGEWSVAEEWVVDWVGPSAAPTVAGHPTPHDVGRSAGRARYDFESDVDMSRFGPEDLDAEMLPPQRELPWLPWHRATFALSLGLFAFVGVRKFAKRFDKASGGRQSPEAESSAALGTSGD